MVKTAGQWCSGSEEEEDLIGKMTVKDLKQINLFVNGKEVAGEFQFVFKE